MRSLWAALVTVWDFLSAIAPVTSAFAIVVTAVFAMKAYRHARYYEKVRLTVAMMESPWLLAAWNGFQDLLNKFASLQEARGAVMQAIKSSPQASTHSPEIVAQARVAIGTITYVSTLFAMNYYDRGVVLLRGGLSILQAYFVFEPVLRFYVERGDYGEEVFALGAAVAKRYSRDPRIAGLYPELVDYVPGSNLVKATTQNAVGVNP